MSCSKIFSGDLPELTYLVIKYFQNDHSNLYSCTLVNRLWCRLAIPLLWENPFSISSGNFNFIEIYLHNLSDDFKTKLSEYKIISNSLPSNLLFNYPMFLKYMNIHEFIFSTEKWFEPAISASKPERRSYMLPVSENLSDICVSLFKIFIENEVNLHTLEIEIFGNYYHTCFDNILELILENTNFIHNIKNLILYIGNSSVYSILMKNRIAQIISLQQNLKKIFLGYYSFPLYQTILLSNDYNCSNTLNTIILYSINFKDINNLDKVFERLNVLGSVHIAYCSSLNRFIQQIINLTKPFKLKSLFLNEVSQIESLKLLLQKSGDYLENFGCESRLIILFMHQLSELITKYCKNIKFLDFHGPECQINHQLFNLIEIVKQNLNYLSIDMWYNYIETGCSAIILQDLGQVLPPNIEYLCLRLYHIKASDFDVFLENSQNIFIKKLLINNSDGQDILPSIKEYIMKKKRVKYLAINDSFPFTFDYIIKELISLKEEVDEFRLYDIEVKSYDSLKINSYNYIKESN